MSKELKYQKLRDILAEAKSAVVALSGGTDSVFLAYTASRISDLRLLAVTVSTPYMFLSEVNEAAVFCRQNAIDHRQVTMSIPETISDNPVDRCYLCKREVMKVITGMAAENGYAFVFDGTNADDVSDYRPGMKALAEYGVRSPLLEAGLTKSDIRALSLDAGLHTWNKPSNACLLTRFPHGSAFSHDDLRRIENAEELLSALGLPSARVRVHGDLARIECRKDFFDMMLSGDVREKIISRLKELGYRYITIDLEGYRTGSMNKSTE